jgi:hypothetical protein
LLGVVNVLAPVLLTKQAWLEAIEAAEWEQHKEKCQTEMFSVHMVAFSKL